MSAADPLCDRLARVGRALALREAKHRGALDEARQRAEELHASVARGLAAFHEAATAGGADPLGRIELGPVRLDEKHIRAIEFEVARGRHHALVVVKSRGEVTLVGPFRAGKAEGPCQSLPWDASDEIASALASFLESFIEEAATP